jgi:hypothetical protein
MSRSLEDLKDNEKPYFNFPTLYVPDKTPMPFFMKKRLLN